MKRMVAIRTCAGPSSSRSSRPGSVRTSYEISLAASREAGGRGTRRCRGRESNPLETDLQSVTLAALSPRRRPPNRRSVIETLETHRVKANRVRDDEAKPLRHSRTTGRWNVESYIRVRVSSDKLLESTPPFHEFRSGGNLYGARDGRGGRTRSCSPRARGPQAVALGPDHRGRGRGSPHDHRVRHRRPPAQPPAVHHRRLGER